MITGLEILEEDTSYSDSIITAIKYNNGYINIFRRNGLDESIAFEIPKSSQLVLDKNNPLYVGGVPRVLLVDSISEYEERLNGDIILDKSNGYVYCFDFDLVQISRGNQYYSDKVTFEKYEVGNYYSVDSVSLRGSQLFICLVEHVSNTESFNNYNWKEVADSEFFFSECELSDTQFTGTILIAEGDYEPLSVNSFSAMIYISDEEHSTISDSRLFSNTQYSDNKITTNLISSSGIDNNVIRIGHGGSNSLIRKIELSMVYRFQGYNYPLKCGVLIRDLVTNQILKEEMIDVDENGLVRRSSKDKTFDSGIYDIRDNYFEVDSNGTVYIELLNINNFESSYIELHMSMESISDFKITYN